MLTWSNAVWNIPVSYILNSTVGRFGILSNISWDDFHAKACYHLSPDGCQIWLAYYMSGDDFCSPLTRLQNSNDWDCAMKDFCSRARNNEVVDFEILDVTQVLFIFGFSQP